jgi:predicted O-methyltransferase YrrM
MQRPALALLRTLPIAVRPRPETWVSLEQVGVSKPPRRPFRYWHQQHDKTFRYWGRSLNTFHRDVIWAPVGGSVGVTFCINIGIAGYLTRPEAAKLYELSYMTLGDVLELGTVGGLAAAIISRALADRGSGAIHSCSADPGAAPAADTAMRGLPWTAPERVIYHLGDVTALLDGFVAEGRKFGFIVANYSTSYDAAYAVASRAPALLRAGGFVQFHNFNDPSARDPADPNKVWQAVDATIGHDPSFRFCIVQGSCAVFQRL